MRVALAIKWFLNFYAGILGEKWKSIWINVLLQFSTQGFIKNAGFSIHRSSEESTEYMLVRLWTIFL